MAVGPFVVETLSVPHDARQGALRVSDGSRRFAVVTDLGHPVPGLQRFMADCDLVFLEANHCPRMLQEGPYPERLKRRVGGPLGHLSNEQAGELASTLQDTRVARLVLVHISRTNNTAERALEVVGTRAPRLAVEALQHGHPARFDVASSGPVQLALALPDAHLAPVSGCR
jgi:phosphoribosyl 1,2-cyclic phosphodiesterase